MGTGESICSFFLLICTLNNVMGDGSAMRQSKPVIMKLPVPVLESCIIDLERKIIPASF